MKKSIDMKRFVTLALSVCCMMAGSSFASFAQDYDVNRVDARATRGAYRPGQVIVKFKNTSGIAMKAPSATRFKTSQVSEVDRVFKQIGVAEVSELMPLTGAETFRKAARSFTGKPIEAKPMAQAYVLTLSDVFANVHEAVEALKTLGDVEYAEPNYMVYALGFEDGDMPSDATDPNYSLQYGIEAINLPALWKQPVLHKEGPVIAILDTGVDIEHPDLKDNIWTNPGEASGASFYDDDRNGFIDDIHGWDFVNQTGEIYDYNGHGTHCAGIAAACGFNGIGIVGANPDAIIMPLTVMQSNGQGDMATIIKAVDYAAANGANIISMSLGSYSASMALEDALGRAYQKAVIVAAAGNDGYCMNHGIHNPIVKRPMPMFPAAYTFVLGVQASGKGGGLAGFSNYDDDGATFSEYGEDKLYNYEVTAPGVSIMSTYPGGGYKTLNGTSMATPLVAGALSRLLQAKNYDNKEVLFGDLINSAELIPSTLIAGDIDIYKAYTITDADRRPELQFITLDMVDADGDGRADAGEEVAFYPIIRNSWGNAMNITYKVECAEPVNTVFDIIEGNAEFGLNLSSYAKARALNPVRIKFHDNVADGRIVRLKFIAQSENTESFVQEFEVKVENAVELTGLLREDLTLTPGQHYVVTGTFGVPEGRTLTIEPGTTIKFRDNASFISEGTVIANGQPGKMITFTKADLDLGKIKGFSIKGNSAISYCIFETLNTSNYYGFDIGGNNICENCIIQNCENDVSLVSGMDSKNINLFNNICRKYLIENCNLPNCNILNNETIPLYGSGITIDLYDGARSLRNSNIFRNHYSSNYYYFEYACIISAPFGYIHNEYPSYFGTSSIEIAKSRVIDINNPLNAIFESFPSQAEYDFSNMPTKPYSEAHGIVWKVLVNGVDAQDEFEKLEALGVGEHKFEVYFNRKMNREVEPFITMGVRAPYTQTAISEKGSWREEEGVDVYTAYLTISGKNDIDGLNRIYVAQAQDDEYFEIPVEDSRFNVLVQAAGSLSSGFMADAGLGRVTLTWDNEEEDNIDDILGFNMYRYEIGADGLAMDTVCINRQLLEPKPEMELVDYDVLPRHTYAYYYRTMRTDMSETSPSKTVAVTPQTATQGDANGSGDVDVADVITTVNYASGLQPKPFIFEAADMNADLEIDILDVVGIIRTILYPGQQMASLAEATATVFVDEDGIVWLDSPVALAGVQINARLEKDGSVKGLEVLNGFEQTGAWLSDEDYIFMAYNMAGRTVSAGRHAVAVVNNGEVSDMRLSDAMGANIKVKFETGESGVEDVRADVEVRPFAKGVYTVTGVKVADNADALNRMPAGVYIVDGQKVIK